MRDRVTWRQIGHIFLGVGRAGESIASQSQRRLTRRPYEGNVYGIRRLAGPASGVYSGGYYLGQLLLGGIVGLNFFFAAA